MSEPLAPWEEELTEEPSALPSIDDERACAWCEARIFSDRCPHCDRVRDMPAMPFVVYGARYRQDFIGRKRALHALQERQQFDASLQLYVRQDTIVPGLEQKAYHMIERNLLSKRDAQEFLRLLRKVVGASLEPTHGS